ncbi:carbamoyltransferase N-terminal domain-containing protein, partial [Acinetobacter baumannii]
LNCVMNARIRDRGPFENVWVQPAAGDAGTSLGAALWTDYQTRGNKQRLWKMDHAYLGPSYADEEIEQFLAWSKLPFERLDNIAEQTAELLAQGQ